MNLRELKKKLDDKGVPASAYSLEGHSLPETFVLSREGNGSWITYYSERGNRESLEYFYSEEDACDHFFSWLSGYY